MMLNRRMPIPHAAIHMHALVVRTAMAYLAAHRVHERSLGGLIETNVTGDTAHRKNASEGAHLNLASRERLSLNQSHRRVWLTEPNPVSPN